MVALANPVRGHIYAKGEARPAGAFVVTSTFAEHVASGRGPGIDIGNGTCGGEILSMGRFRVAEAFTVREGPYAGAKVVRYDLLDYPGYQAGIAHMNAIETAVGVTGPAGVVIGHIGNSGGVPCHLHGGMKLNGVESDWWALLAQNQEADMLGIETVTLLEGGPRQFTIPAGTTLNGYDPARPGAPIISRLWSTSSSAPADARVAVAWPGTTGPPVPNGYPFLRCTAGVYAGLLVLERLVQLAPAPPTPAPDCSAAVKAATDPLNARIATIKAKVAAGASDISDD